MPAGWEPTILHSAGLAIAVPNTVIEDADIVGDLDVMAENVTIRRCRVTNGQLLNRHTSVTFPGMLVEDTTIRTTGGWFPSAGPGTSMFASAAYTARRVAILDVGEGFRVGGSQSGDVLIEDCFVRVVDPNFPDWHGDALQAFNGSRVTVRNTTLINPSPPDDVGTSAFWHPDQGNTYADVDRLLVQGGGYSFRLQTPGSVTGLYCVRDSARFGPRQVTSCELLDAWEAQECDLDGDGQPVNLTPLEC